MKKIFNLVTCVGSGLLGIGVLLFYLGRRKVEIINEEDRTSEILDNTIQVRGVSVGEYERGFQTRVPAVFPTGSYAICTPSVETITIGLTADKPQRVWYPERWRMHRRKKVWWSTL